MKRPIAVVASAALLAGCNTIPLRTDGQVGVDDVMRRIKAELREYYDYMHAHADDPALKTACAGQIEFKIKSVAVTLSSQSDDTLDVNGSASLPVGAVLTLGPSLDVQNEVKSTKSLKYTFYPVDPGAAPAKITETEWVGFPIASSLEQLREALLKASDTTPCEIFSAPAEVGPPAKAAVPADQTVTFDFTVVHTGKGGANLKFVLFSVGGTGTHQVQSGNNVVVTFTATPTSVGVVSLLNRNRPWKATSS